MKLLNELLMLSESKEKNLLGLTINRKEITSETKLHPWSGDFNCGLNNLTSLEFCPSEVGGNFYCNDNKLTSLEHGPSEVGGYFDCYKNNLTSLKDIHKQLHKMNGYFNCGANKLTSHVLGVLLISGCEKLKIDNKEVEAIVNKYLPNNEGRKGLLKCKGELVDAGFDAFAQL